MNKYNSLKKFNNGIKLNSSDDFIVVVSDGAEVSCLLLVETFVGASDFGVATDSVDISSNRLLEDFGVATDSVNMKSVANYNSRKSYNKKWDAGGASYNSYKHHIVTVEDSGSGDDLLNLVFDGISLIDNGIAREFISLEPFILGLNDNGITKDIVELVSFVYTTDSGSGDDLLRLVFEFPALEYFFVTTDSILQPLGVMVTGDSRHELIPSTRDNFEEIPGMHGEIDFGSEFKSRMMELDVATDYGYTPFEKSQLERLFSMYLNPIKGTKKLVFADDMDKTYIVKYSGKIDPTNHPNWFEFVIPFKMSDPFIHGTVEKFLAGSGKLANDGTFETGLIIEITGPVTNPSVKIGDENLIFSGTITSGAKLIIDTKKGTVKIGSNNAIGNYNGVFPLLYPGETIVVSSNNVTIKWRDKWI